ncbi:hypothetical protein ES703_102024 [subsurface metagenome]
MIKDQMTAKHIPMGIETQKGTSQRINMTAVV